MLRVIFRNSDFRFYRESFFDLLCEKHQVKFVFRHCLTQNKYESISIGNDKSTFWSDPNFLIAYANWLFSKFDVFVTSLPTHPISLVGTIISKLRRRGVVYWIEGWNEPKGKGSKILVKRLYYKYVLKLADSYFVTSTKAEEFIVTFTKTDRSRIFKSLQANLDLSVYEPIYPEINLPKDYLVFLYFGRIIKLKGLDLLLRGFSIVNKVFPSCVLLIVGEGDFKEDCLEIINQEKLQNIVLGPSVDDISYGQKAGIYQISSVFILPSTKLGDNTEGWGLTVGEAMSLGKPIIITDAVGCADDLVINGLNGYVVKHGSSQDLADAMLLMLKNKEKLRNMGEESRKLFADRISHSHMAETLSNAIHYSMKQNNKGHFYNE